MTPTTFGRRHVARHVNREAPGRAFEGVAATTLAARHHTGAEVAYMALRTNGTETLRLATWLFLPALMFVSVLGL